MIRQFGLSNFEELPFPYWEQPKEGETKSEYHGRRNSEGIKFRAWLLKKSNKKSPILKKRRAGSPPQQAAPSSKVSRASDEEMEKLKEEVASLRHQITALMTKMTGLEKALKEEREKNRCICATPSTSSAAAAAAPPSEDLRKLVNDIVSPVLKTLSGDIAQEKKKSGPKSLQQPKQQQSKPQQSKPQQPKQQQPKPQQPKQQQPKPQQPKQQQPKQQPPKQQPSTLGKSYALVTQATSPQIVGSGPAAEHVRRSIMKPDEAPTGFAFTRHQKRRMRKANPKQPTSQPSGPPPAKKPTQVRASKMDPKTLLLLPNGETLNVLQRIQNLAEADPRKLGVKRVTQFPSGAALITCGGAQQAEMLRQIALAAGIREKRAEVRLPEVRLHGVPRSTTPEQIQEDVKRRFGVDVEAKLFPYRDSRMEGKCFAVLTCTSEGQKVLAKAKALRIGWAMCKLDATVHVTRCTRCGLLGHGEAKCSRVEEDAEAGTGAGRSGNSEMCRDCTAHNTIRSTAAATSSIKARPRPTNHRTGSKECPTLRAFTRKAMPTPASRSGPSGHGQSQ